MPAELFPPDPNNPQPSPKKASFLRHLLTLWERAALAQMHEGSGDSDGDGDGDLYYVPLGSFFGIPSMPTRIPGPDEQNTVQAETPRREPDPAPYSDVTPDPLHPGVANIRRTHNPDKVDKRDLALLNRPEFLAKDFAPAVNMARADRLP